jgi:hypothetical protein
MSLERQVRIDAGSLVLLGIVLGWLVHPVFLEVKDFVTGQPTQVPLAGPANRQGRIAADHIFGRDANYRGTRGTAIVRVFERTAAMTGASEKTLQRLKRS